MPTRRILHPLHIDTNRINARGTLKAMKQLEILHQAGIVYIEMSEVAQREARSGNDPRRRRKAADYIATLTYADTPEEHKKLHEIAKILFPNGLISKNELNDVKIVFNSWKYGARLVTADGGSKRQPGGIIGNRASLKNIGVNVMTDEEALDFVEDQIKQRDKYAREVSNFTGEPLPEWVGKDGVREV